MVVHGRGHPVTLAEWRAEKKVLSKFWVDSGVPGLNQVSIAVRLRHLGIGESSKYCQGAWHPLLGKTFST